MKTKKTVYWVEECEGIEGWDGSVSTDYPSLKAAKAKAKEILANPGKWVSKVKVWKSILVSENDTH